MSFLGNRSILDNGGLGAFVLSAICTAGLIALVLFVLSAISAASYPDAWPATVFMSLMFFLVAMVIIAVAGLVVGLPVTWVFSSNGLEAPWTYPLTGFLSGAIIVLIVLWLSGFDSQQAFLDFLPTTLIGAVPGGIYGTFWWLFYRRHRQDG